MLTPTTLPAVSLSPVSQILADIAFPADQAVGIGVIGIAVVIGGLAIAVAVVLGGFILLKKRGKRNDNETSK